MSFIETPLNGDIVYKPATRLAFPPLYDREMIENVLQRVGFDPSSFNFAEEGSYLEATHPELRINIQCRTELDGWEVSIRIPRTLQDRGRASADGLWGLFQERARKMYDRNRITYRHFPETYEFSTEQQ